MQVNLGGYMPRKKIPLILGQYYHIYNRAIAKNPLFREDRNYNFFLSRIEIYLQPAVKLLAYCLMPNHYHFILKLTTNNLSAAMHKLALSYANSYNRVYDQKGHLFQGPFQRKQINDLDYLVHLSRYVHLNPLKANLVQTAEDWQYSSYQSYLGFRKPVLVDPTIILDLFTDHPGSSLSERQSDYKKFVEQWNFEYMEFKLQR
jgi:REP element-mobilizing transposase RayT